MKKIRFIFILLSIFSMTYGQEVEVRFTSPYSRAKQTVRPVNKDQLIELIDKGEYKIIFNESEKERFVKSTPINSLLGENKVVTFDVVNKTNHKLNNIQIDTNIPDDWNPIMYKQALIFDWYSLHKKVKDINFWGDPLIKLLKNKNSYLIDLDPKETVRVVCEFTPSFPTERNLSISIKRANKTLSSVKENILVYNKAFPKQDYSSIIFNSINAVSSVNKVKTWKKTGLTHLQVNHIPTVYFDKEGNAISQIDQKTSSSKGFRDTAYPWVKKDGSILLFWQARYKKLAPLKDGTFLKPFTPQWNKAFSQLLDIVCTELAKQYPYFKQEQVIVYLADEVSSMDNNYMLLIDYLKKYNPNIKIMTTFGFYSLPTDLIKLYPRIDISTMHFIMPDSLTLKGKKYYPHELKIQIDNMKVKGKKENWLYNVESGLKSDIRSFRFYPLIGAVKGYTGFSWWAYASHSGSTWSANRNKRLNYSMYYDKETKNPVHNMWTKKTDFFSQPAYPSMRLLAAEAGLKDAKLILYLTKNEYKMDRRTREQFNTIINQLENLFFIPKGEFNLPSLVKIEELSYQLREIYVNLHENE